MPGKNFTKILLSSSWNLEIFGILTALKIFRWTLLGIESITVYSDNLPAVSFLKNGSYFVDPIIPIKIRNLLPLFLELEVSLEYIPDKDPLLGLSDYMSRESKSEFLINSAETSPENIFEVNMLKTRIIDKPLFLVALKKSDIASKQENDNFSILHLNIYSDF